MCFSLGKGEDMQLTIIKESSVFAEVHVYAKCSLFELHLPAKALTGFRTEKNELGKKRRKNQEKLNED